MLSEFQFTHPGKGATGYELDECPDNDVSIHAPWEGCDHNRSILLRSSGCFNSRTLGRVRHHISRKHDNTVVFQFTHPGKGATKQELRLLRQVPSFNSRTLGRVRQCRRARRGLRQCFNSRTLGRVRHHPRLPQREPHRRFNSRTLGRVRLSRVRFSVCALEFQFTHPGKGATARDRRQSEAIKVSIHAPWEGCDEEGAE